MKEPLHIRVEKEMPDVMPRKHAGEARNACRRLAGFCHGGIDEGDQWASVFKGALTGSVSARLISVISEFNSYQIAVFEGEIADKLQ